MHHINHRHHISVSQNEMLTSAITVSKSGRIHGLENAKIETTKIRYIDLFYFINHERYSIYFIYIEQHYVDIVKM